MKTKIRLKPVKVRLLLRPELMRRIIEGLPDGLATFCGRVDAAQVVILDHGVRGRQRTSVLTKLRYFISTGDAEPPVTATKLTPGNCVRVLSRDLREIARANSSANI
jgi:hypothetical protein